MTTLTKEELEKYTDSLGNVNLYGTSFTRLSDDLIIDGNMDLKRSNIIKLPKNLTVVNDLNMENTEITKIPEDLDVFGKMYLEGTRITNYPVVYNCGSNRRAIYLDLIDKNIIHIGCFSGTKEEAIKRIKSEYLSKYADMYISKVEECFDMYENMKRNKLKN